MVPQQAAKFLWMDYPAYILIKFTTPGFGKSTDARPMLTL